MEQSKTAESEARNKAIAVFKSAREAHKSGNLSEAQRLYAQSAEQFQTLMKSGANPNMNTLFRSMVEACQAAQQAILRAQHPLPEETKAAAHRRPVLGPEIKVPRPVSTHRPDTKFSEIAGMVEAKAFLMQRVAHMTTEQDKWKEAEKVLLYGPAGTGKTLLAKALLTEADVSGIFFFNANDLAVMYHSEAETTLKTLFQAAIQAQPSIVFIDEIDQLAEKRPDENAKIAGLRQELVKQCSATIKNEKVLLLAATNAPWKLAPEVVACFNQQLMVELPDAAQRAKIIKKTLKASQHMLTKADIEEIAKMTEGHTGAGMMVMVRDAQFAPIRRCMNAPAFRLNKESRYVPTTAGDPHGIAGGLQNLPNAERIKMPAVQKADVMDALSRFKAGVGFAEIKKFLKWDGVREFHGGLDQ